MHTPYRLGLIGVGKIALAQHLPALARSTAFEVVAAVDPRPVPADVPRFGSVEEMLAAGPPLDAVSICTPPGGRYPIARAAIVAGLAVMLEKPPGATLAEVELLTRQARAAGTVLFGAWHSREAAGVRAAAAWLAGRTIREVTIDWREDIRQWHPGQEWIMAPGGFGVFDPAINAFSIATAILPGTLVPHRAILHVPSNRQAPISAEIDMTLDGGAPVHASLNFLQSGEQTWEIVVRTDGGCLRLSDGGAKAFVDEAALPFAPSEEYPNLYARFADLIASSRTDVDASPLSLVADIFLIAHRTVVDPFHF